jgi:hypothetical protein
MAHHPPRPWTPVEDRLLQCANQLAQERFR